MATVEVSLNDIDAGQISAAVNSTLVEGSTVSQWWKSQERLLVSRVTRTVRSGIRDGLSSRDIAANLRTNAFKGTRAQAQALVSTAVNAVSNRARQDSFAENDDVIKGMQQVSTLDNRTSDVCIAYSGMAWDLDGNPLPDSGTTLPFNGGPPRHFNCRSTLIPVLKSFEELGIKTQTKLPTGTRASMDGQVPADITFSEFLSKKSITFQNQLLGRARAKLWRDGRITLNQLVDMRGNPLSVQQLVERAAKARAVGRPDPFKAKFTSASAWRDSFDDDIITADDIILRGTKEQRQSINVFEKKIAAGKSTQELHFVDGEWSVERQRVHQRILNDIFSEENLRKATPASGSPTVTVLGGRGGSGKTFLTEGAKAPVDLNKTIVLNSDLFKEALPEWDGWNAALLHEESSYLLKAAEKMAIQRNVNVVLDITMQGGVEKILKKLTPFLNKGYGVEAHYMHLPRQEAAFRALGRSTKANNPRYVPTQIILDSVDNEVSFDYLVDKGIAKRWSFWDNQVPFGQDPRPIAGNL